MLLVARGPQEREMVTFLVEHFETYPRHLAWLQELHVQQLREVLAMKNLTPEQIGLDYQALLDMIGKEEAIDLIGKEEVLADLLRRQGEQRLREQLERLRPPPETPEQS